MAVYKQYCTREPHYAKHNKLCAFGLFSVFADIFTYFLVSRMTLLFMLFEFFTESISIFASSITGKSNDLSSQPFQLKVINMSDTQKQMERFRNVFRDGINFFPVYSNKSALPVCVIDFFIILSMKVLLYIPIIQEFKNVLQNVWKWWTCIQMDRKKF